MVAYLVLGICLLAALLLAGRWALTADPRVLANVVRYGGIGVLGVIAAFLIFTGRFGMGLLPALLAFTIWRASRGGMRFPLGGGMGGFGGFGSPSPGRSSDVETDYLRMSLEHDTGVMHGEIRKGPFAGRTLADLSLDELLALFAECRAEDPQSAQLLETYLDRTQGPDWREAADQSDAGGGSRSSSGGGGAMTVEEAREILGVEAGASADDIRAAHHRLMLINHPDKGGSSYLAAKINQAKDILLKS